MIPKKLVLDNFLSHSHSEVDFDNFNAALIIGSHDGDVDSSNGCGKSAIVESIQWVLFDKCRRKKKDGIVKRDEQTCTVEFQFEVAGQLYRILRQRNKVVGESTVNLAQWVGSEFKPIDCDTNSATDDKIVNIINFNHEVFLNSVYFRQGDVAIFTDSTAGKRKDVLKALLKLDQWDNYQDKAKNYVKATSAKIEEKEAQVVSEESLTALIKKYDDEIRETKRQLKEGGDQYNELSSKLVDKKSEHQSLAGEDGDKKLEEIRQDIINTKKRLAEITKLTTTNNEKVKKAKANISEYHKQIASLKVVESKADGISLDKEKENLLVGRTKESLLKEQILNLQKDINLEDGCEVCLRPIESKDVELIIRKKRKEKLDENKKKYSEILLKLKGAEEKFKNSGKFVDTANKARLERDKIGVRISSLNNEIAQTNEENNKLNEELETLKAKGHDNINTKGKFDKEYADKLKDEIESIEGKLKEVKKKSDRLNMEFGIKVNEKNKLAAEQKKQEELKKDLEKLNGSLSIYDKLVKCFGKDGIQSIIIENVIEELETNANEILEKICTEPTSITIKTQRQTDKGDWVETFDIEVNINGQADELESLSGGEEFRISFALRLALSKILSNRMGGCVKFLLLDEVSSFLDAKGLSLFSEIVHKLSKDMKILVITHDDKLKDKFNDVIVVEKTAAGSCASI